jgi:hypothetical protein
MKMAIHRYAVTIEYTARKTITVEVDDSASVWIKTPNDDTLLDVAKDIAARKVSGCYIVEVIKQN